MKDAASRIIVLLCHERAGSTYLTDCLARSAGIKSAGDLWNYAAHGASATLGFHRFRADWLQAQGMPPSPLDDTLFALLDDYFVAIAKSGQGRTVLVDIKYAHLHAVSGFWFNTSSGSLFFSYLRSRGIRLIHLYRRDVFAAIASMHLALARGVWNIRGAAPIEAPPRITLDREILALQLAELAVSAMAHKLFCLRLGGLNLAYEDLVSGDGFDAIARYLGLVWNELPSSDIVKVSPPPTSFVRNITALGDLAEAYQNIDITPPMPR